MQKVLDKVALLLNKDRLHFNIKLLGDASHTQIASNESLYCEQIGTINNYQVS